MNGDETDQEKRAKWRQLLERAISNPEDPLIVTAFRKGWNSSARPVFVRCIDKKDYVIKGQQAGRQIINEQIVARLGKIMGAPVAEARIVEISSDLIEIEPQFDYLTPGTAHGTLFIKDCFDDRDVMKYREQIKNRSRFALLSVLYGWISAQDHQFIYHKTQPNLVYSVDHGAFFPNGLQWTEDDLRTAPKAKIDSLLSSRCRLTEDELQEALEKLEMVTEDDIIRVVAVPPQEWRFTMEERVTMVEYLIRRQQELLELL